MTSPTISPYGSWKSPITSDLIVAAAVRLAEPRFDGEDVYWLEMRPQEKGRYVVVKRASDGETIDVTPPPYSARTRVHEYGGASYAVFEGWVVFSNDSDGRLYVVEPGGKTRALTPEGAFRYADIVHDTRRNRLICIVEDHTNAAPYPTNTVAAVSLDDGAVTVLMEGSDFYSNPRLSPDGRTLSWLSWDFPDMPWDNTDLYEARVLDDGLLGEPRKVAGGGGSAPRRDKTRRGTQAESGESIFQPEWSAEGVLHFASDRTDWWNLYRLEEDGAARPLSGTAAEFAMPQWVFGMRTYDFDSDGSLIAAYTCEGDWHIGRIDAAGGEVRRFDLPFTAFDGLRVRNGKAVFVASGPAAALALVLLDVETLEYEILKRSADIDIDAAYVSPAESIEFETEGGLTAHALYYAPKSPDFAAPEGELPPLLVNIHGGPTSQARSGLSLGKQYWTSRGFAVVDVNYGGSTGYGRKYRDRLNGQWGVVDMDDCCNAARHLAAAGIVDGERLAITGGSAGGYTTLCALVFRDVFMAGASHFGVSDAEALAVETHKFEARYLDRLIGPYPAERDLYVERSPIHFAGRLDRPVAFFQGLEDRIVPPDQAEKMVAALKEKGLPVAYVAFEGEQHGFRQAEHIKRALDGEFYFYSRIFGFEPADEIEPVEIWNLP
jgi:dipeptidyl aminopeptidase/acylaminoacyl peptidase